MANFALSFFQIVFSFLKTIFIIVGVLCAIGIILPFLIPYLLISKVFEFLMFIPSIFKKTPLPVKEKKLFGGLDIAEIFSMIKK